MKDTTVRPGKHIAIYDSHFFLYTLPTFVLHVLGLMLDWKAHPSFAHISFSLYISIMNYVVL